MSKKTYEFDNRKPNVVSKIGSTVIAVGSVATALTIAMPGAGAFFVPQSSTANSDSNQTETANAAALVSGQQASNAAGSNPTATGAEASGQTGSNLPTAMASTNADINLFATSDPTSVVGTTPLPSATASGVQTPAPTPTPTTAAPPLELAPIAAGNVSSATPIAGSATQVGSIAGQTPTSGTANVSSPTPIGSSGYDDDDDDDDDRYERDHDDDDHDDDDRDHDDDDD
jgi:hypothetical protein